MQIDTLSPLQVSSVCVLSFVRKWEKYMWNCGHRISRPEVHFQAVSLELNSVYVMQWCKFQVNHLKNKRDLRHQKSRKWKVFWQLPGVDKSVSVGANIYWYYKRNTFNFYRFNFRHVHWKRKTFKKLLRKRDNTITI